MPGSFVACARIVARWERDASDGSAGFLCLAPAYLPDGCARRRRRFVALTEWAAEGVPHSPGTESRSDRESAAPPQVPARTPRRSEDRPVWGSVQYRPRSLFGVRPLSTNDVVRGGSSRLVGRIGELL